MAGRTAREPRPAPPAATTVHPVPAQAPVPARPTARRAGRVLKWTVSIVLLSAIGYGSWHFADQLGKGGSQALGTTGIAGSPSASATTAAQTPVAISDVTSFNPYGTGPMHPELLALTHDNDPNTFWQTEGYYDNLDTIGHGTGLLVDLGSAKSVATVIVQFGGGTTKAELRVPTSAGDTAPTQLSDFGDPLAQSTGTAAEFRPAAAVRTRYLLIWLTSLPKDGGNKFRGQVAEIKVTG